MHTKSTPSDLFYGFKKLRPTCEVPSSSISPPQGPRARQVKVFSSELPKYDLSAPQTLLKARLDKETTTSGRRQHYRAVSGREAGDSRGIGQPNQE